MGTDDVEIALEAVQRSADDRRGRRRPRGCAPAEHAGWR